jgi:hypothetical protein
MPRLDRLELLAEIAEQHKGRLEAPVELLQDHRLRKTGFRTWVAVSKYFQIKMVLVDVLFSCHIRQAKSGKRYALHVRNVIRKLSKTA